MDGPYVSSHLYKKADHDQSFGLSAWRRRNVLSRLTIYLRLAISSQTTNKKEQMPPQCLFLLMREFEFSEKPIKKWIKQPLKHASLSKSTLAFLHSIDNFYIATYTYRLLSFDKFFPSWSCLLTFFMTLIPEKVIYFNTGKSTR